MAYRISLVLLLACLSFGCQKGPSTEGPSGTGSAANNLRIAVIPKGTTHEFWKSVHAGAEKAAREAGNVTILWKGQIIENDQDGQMRVVQDLITQEVDGICLAPLDSQALVEYVAEAHESGVPTVIFDSGLNDTSCLVSYVATDNYRGGALAARRLAESMESKGNVILLRYNPGSESTEQRERGFLETLEAEFPEIKVISSDEYAGTTPESSLDKATQVLQKHKGNVNGIFAVCEPNANGVLGALREVGLAGQVKFVAFDPSPPLINGLSEGTVDGIVLQDPVTMGYEAVRTMLAHLKGEQVKARVSTGEFMATPDNSQDPEIDRLLHPAQAED